jgi:hypothetical protein
MTVNLRQSAIILKRISNQLKNVNGAFLYVVEKKMDVYNSTFDNEELFKLNTCIFGLTNYSFIWYVSFLDEYNRHFKSLDADEQERVDLIKIKTKEYIDTITEIFGDIKTARNRVLAHGYRNYNGQILENEEINTYFNQLSDFKSPTPFLQISNITSLIVQEIENVFGEIPEDEISL